MIKICWKFQRYISNGFWTIIDLLKISGQHPPTFGKGRQILPKGPSINYVSMIWAIFNPSLPHVSIHEHFNTPSLMLTWAFTNFDLYLSLKSLSLAIRSKSWFCSCKIYNCAVLQLFHWGRNWFVCKVDFQSVLDAVFLCSTNQNW